MHRQPLSGEVLVSSPADFSERKADQRDDDFRSSPSSVPNVEDSAPVILDYQGRKLLQQNKKSAGKNQSNLDGFYVDEASREYFIKVPKDKRELFTELFAGLILTELKKARLIDPKIADLLVCAEAIKLPDGSYGLIQPKRKFTEIWKYFKERTPSSSGIMGSLWKNFTDTISGSGDRNVLDEMFFGQAHYYPLLAELNGIDSLAASMLFSMIIGDYSVHSANVVYFEKEQQAKKQALSDSLSDSGELVERSVVEFGRIDWGAAWRNYGHPRNQDVMNPMEYHGYKGYTKGYHRFYTQVPGLFQAVSAQALELQRKFGPAYLVKLVTSAVNQLPVDLLTPEERAETADYIGLDKFKGAGIGNEHANRDFARDLATIMSGRIDNLANLPRLQPDLIQKSAPHLQVNMGVPVADRLTPNRMFDFAFTKLNKAGNEYREEARVQA